MASLFQYRGKIHLEYKKDGKRVRENLNLVPNTENWGIAKNKMKEAEILYETENEDSLIKKLLKKELDSSELTLLQCIERFQKHISRTSEKHQQNFIYAMNPFAKVVDPKSKIDKITSNDMVKYLTYLSEKVGNSTQRTYYTYIKLFFSYLVKEDLLSKSPCRNIKPPAEIENEIVIFEDKELNMILEAAKKRDIEFYLILKFLIYTGARPNDVLRLKVKDVDKDEAIIKIKISKTKNHIRFPIYKELAEFLDGEMADILKQDPESILFPNYTVNNLGQNFRKLKKKLGIPKEKSLDLKTFRKTFATKQLNRGVRLEYVGYMLGHKKLQTTKKHYASVNVDSVKNEIDNIPGQLLKTKNMTSSPPNKEPDE